MKIAIIGASGTIGQRIRDEALARGHDVAALVRDTARVPGDIPHLLAVRADVFDVQSIAAAAFGSDVIISAYAPPQDDPEQLERAATALLEAARRLAPARLIIVGGAGSLEVAPGVQLVDTPEFPAAWKGIANAHRTALDVYRANDDVDWTYISPAAFIQPGERTGSYRTGTDQLVTNAAGESRISAEDFAIAVLDEIETPRFRRKRFTAAY